MHPTLFDKRPPLVFTLLLAAYPVLSAYLWNSREIPLHVLWRPLFLAAGVALMLWFLIQGLTRNQTRSALITGLFILLFSSYGQVHHALEEISVYDDFPFQHWFFWVPSGWLCSSSALSPLPKNKPGDNSCGW